MNDGVIGRLCGVSDGSVGRFRSGPHFSKPFLNGVALAVDSGEFFRMTKAHQHRRLFEFTAILLDGFLDPVVEIIIAVTLDMLDQNLPQHAGVQRFQSIQLGRASTIARLEAGSARTPTL